MLQIELLQIELLQGAQLLDRAHHSNDGMTGAIIFLFWLFFSLHDYTKKIFPLLDKISN